jgi:1-acyl-sn-glycerol-3-phosphate acyltransferase
VCITGLENIPENTPLFFAPNHQNALMDALAIICSIKKQPVFIARADIFKNPVIARILILFKILPAFRIRDGKENLKKNEEIFDISVKILENKNILTLFPETTHTDLKRLRELKKGVQRIVFQAEEKNKFNLGIKILPIGIYYSNYWNIQSTVQINYGKPIEINEYLDIFKQNPQKAMLSLRDRISEEILPLIIHIENEEYYHLFDFMREFSNKKMRAVQKLNNNQMGKFKADQLIIENLERTFKSKPEIIKELYELVNEYRNILNNNNLRHWVIEKNEQLSNIILKSVLLIISAPVFIYGFINNLIPFYLHKPITSKLKDRQFTTSITFVIGMIFFPVFYLIQSATVFIFSETLWMKLSYFVSLPVTGYIAFKLHRLFIKVRAQINYLTMKNKDQGKLIENLKSRIDSQMERIIVK